MGSSEEEESGMKSGVNTYSRSGSRREVRESPAKVEEGETLDENEAGSLRKRRRSENTLDHKRMKVQGISKICSNGNNAAIAAGESEVENNNVSSRKSDLPPLQPQAVKSPKLAEKGAAVSKTPGNRGKEPIPPCIKKKVKKLNGSNTTYYHHACDDYNYEDMRQVDRNCVMRLASSVFFYFEIWSLIDVLFRCVHGSQNTQGTFLLRA